ncbi:FkbM family methyltransferase [Mesorhizobium sp.]|uniref:FkbM family methyltransferase n=1 Tax=Mesorhizobium sp. TaxID=1871066 RepID=UPI000FE309EE|nr:FkbM family methyltransferase [Mesorhizobium sp.]RWP27957.1 MAG: FkbM family methyltransferase [Mesorhizobium sp.]RWP69443.1 MAG: FkbM family methyltransferase [Mesorhizobium sp.]RWQ14440.1 MAG: FkbM family methyltransferase [Mesorhizobium sp.]
MITNLARTVRDYAFAAATAGKKSVTVEGATLSLEGVSSRMRYVMFRGYETRDAELAEKFITKTDKVIEAGSSIGFMAITIIKNIGVSHYCMVEANPRLGKIVRENFRLSSVPFPIWKNVAVGASDGEISFGIGKNFWSSSTLARDNELERVTVPMVSVPTLLRDLPFSPNVLIMDIEGAETSIPASDFRHFDKLIIEFHPKLSGTATTDELKRGIIDQGFKEVASAGGTSVFLKV